jgi:hypothetical protein
MIRLSSSSSATSGAISGTLTWSKIPRSRDYELQLNGETAGTLRRPGWFETSFLAETPDGQWTFRRGGCFGGGSEIFSSNSDSVSRQLIASFKSSWGTGGGTLTFADGQTFQLRCEGWWRPVWSVIGQSGETLLRLQVRERMVEVPSGAGSGEAVPENRLLLLIMFAFYRVLQAEEDAATAVMVAGVS